jgi:hypothetical protein
MKQCELMGGPCDGGMLPKPPAAPETARHISGICLGDRRAALYLWHWDDGKWYYLKTIIATSPQDVLNAVQEYYDR